ncbi:MAG: primosomal protein N', partial [Coriobacteriaceae bacterium]|nr:primosomal protein N' [Coriobacteriaceae bacterium]
MRLASVILDIPAQVLEAPYTYVVPDTLGALEVGCAVLVPFGNRDAIGFVMALEGPECLGALDPVKLKTVRQVLSRSYFDEEGAACARYLSEAYIAPLSSCVRLLTPPQGVPRLVRRGKAWQVEDPVIAEVDDRWVRATPAAEGFTARKGAVKQQAIVDALRRGELRVAELAMEFGPVSAALKALAAKGVVELFCRRRERGCPPHLQSGFNPSGKPCLTRGQEEALAVIRQAQKKAAGEVVLVDGVTGSGKTEVYLQAIEHCLDQGKKAIVLVPEISLTPQTVARFRGRFGDTVAVMHSRMGAGERFDQWDRIRKGDAQVVVGARSALFVPLRDLGLVIIDEEHEGSYKQESAPRYHARDVAAWMVAQRGATLVLGSATPSIEALHCAKTFSWWHHTVLPDRVNASPLPRIEVVDMARLFGSGDRSMFSPKLASAIHEVIDAGHKAVLLLNQRGFAQFLLCRDCGFVPSCPSCALSLTYHERGNCLVCHHCGHRQPVPARCPLCASPYLKRFGAGTQRVETELRSLLSERIGKGEASIIRMDADTTTGKGAHQRLLEEFGNAGSAVLLGTQMIAKGL